MKFCIELYVEDAGPPQAQATRLAHSLIRYAQAVSMLGTVPRFAPLWAVEGGLIGRAWTDEEIESTREQGGAA